MEDTSGGRERRRLGSITKQGNAYLRTLLPQAAHTILWHKNQSGGAPLRRWADSIAERPSIHTVYRDLCRFDGEALEELVNIADPGYGHDHVRRLAIAMLSACRH
ncbi:transposase [Sorangium sp. So ce448]|uniref:transposase n=1 Tax=Sorangium sp. So ce448 TaxID=3133314 RepID=UPI003F647E5D